MLLLAWFVFGTMILGILAGGTWWLIRGRKTKPTSGAVVLFTALGSGVAFLGAVFLRTVSAPLLFPSPLPDEITRWLSDAQFTKPLALGICAVIILAFPLTAPSSRGSADLTPRNPFSFGQKRWFIGMATIVGVIVIVTVLAGMASEPDDEGLWRSITVDFGTTTIGTGIYGWYYSVPALALLAVLLAATVLALWLIARPAIGVDHVNDALTRRWRTRNVVAVASGALLLHLATIFSSLAGSAGLRGTIPVGADGSGTFGTSFAALQPAFVVATFAVGALGYALWVGVLLSTIGARRAAVATVRS